MSPIKDLDVTYEALNKEQTFSPGDTIRGKVTFTLTEETKVKKLGVKAKGHAHVHWSSGTGDNRRSHTANRTYFNVKSCFIEKGNDSTALSEGDHCYKFSLQIPTGDVPPSFKGIHGFIKYTLEAKISRSWKLPTVVQKELQIVSNCAPYSFSQSALSGSVEKGKVKMSATIDKNICCPGDTITVNATISSKSSKKIKPKFSIEEKVRYNAFSSSTSSYKKLNKYVGESITKHSEENVISKLTVPVDAIPSFSNCDIISVKHTIKAYLDISFAIDPEVLLELYIVPARSANLQHNEAIGPYPAGPAGAQGYSDFPPAFTAGPYVGPPGPYSTPPGPGAPLQSGQAQGPYATGPFGAMAGYGSFPPPAFPMGSYPTNQGSGSYTHPPPGPSQQAPPYAYPAPIFPPSAVPPQGPSAPPIFQQGEDPPTYKSLYPPFS